MFADVFLESWNVVVGDARGISSSGAAASAAADGREGRGALSLT